MPPRLARVTAEQTLRALKRLGFIQVRQRGSHIVLQKKLQKEPLVVLCRIAVILYLYTNWNIAKYPKTSGSYTRRVYGKFVNTP